MELLNKPCYRIKEVRKMLNLTQIEFASTIGVDQGYLSQIENGKVALSNSILFKLNQKFKVSSDWLLWGTGNMFLYPSHNYNLTSAIQNLEKLLSELKREQKELEKIQIS